jgi:hypothetical protein
MKKSEDGLKVIEAEHLGILTSNGRHLIGIAEGASSLLESDWSNENKLSDEEKQKLFKMLLDALRKHDELITWSITERQEYIISMQEQDDSE